MKKTLLIFSLFLLVGCGTKFLDSRFDRKSIFERETTNKINHREMEAIKEEVQKEATPQVKVITPEKKEEKKSKGWW